MTDQPKDKKEPAVPPSRQSGETGSVSDSASTASTDAQVSVSNKGLTAFWAELKRRKVMRVAIAYTVVGWVIMQVADLTFEGFGIPIWAFRFVMLCVILGFPIAIILAWAFDLTPDGIKTTKKADVERGDAPVSEKQQRNRNWFTFLFGAAVPTLIFGALAVFFYIRSGGAIKESGADLSIAVLPLDNLSPDQENAFFADGMQEDILSKLSQIEALRVISRTSTLVYRDSVKQSREIGEELNVRYLVEGSVRRIGDQVRITVQLIDAALDEHLWAGNYNRTLDDIFAIQAEVAKEIAEKLHTVLSPEEVEKIEYRPTENQQAYDFYVRARILADTTDGVWDEKTRLLESAVALDPGFEEAWAWMAHEYSYWWLNSLNDRNQEPVSDRKAKSLNAIERAKHINPESAIVLWAQATLARNLHEDRDQQLLCLLQAVDKDPNFIHARNSLSVQLFISGRLSEMQHHLEYSVQINPLDRRTTTKLITAYQLQDLWKQAQAVIQRSSKRDGDKDHWDYRASLVAYNQNGDKQGLIESLSENTSFMASRRGKALFALLSRNYPVVVDYLNDPDDTEGFFFPWDFLRSYTFNFDFFNPSLQTALIWFELGDEDKWLAEAKIAQQAIFKLVGEPEFVAGGNKSSLALCYALLGDKAKAESAIGDARRKVEDSSTPYFSHTQTEAKIAACYLVLGDHDKAIETLEATSKVDGPIFLHRELNLWFIFDRLRGNPRFDALLED